VADRVVVKRVCENLGIDHGAQQERLRRKDWATVGLIPTVIGDQAYEVFCLDLESLPMWLATIDANRVKPEDLDVTT